MRIHFTMAVRKIERNRREESCSKIKEKNNVKLKKSHRAECGRAMSQEGCLDEGRNRGRQKWTKGIVRDSFGGEVPCLARSCCKTYGGVSVVRTKALCRLINAGTPRGPCEIVMKVDRVWTVPDTKQETGEGVTRKGACLYWPARDTGNE